MQAYDAAVLRFHRPEAVLNFELAMYKHLRFLGEQLEPVCVATLQSSITPRL
jgi:hypothetical protein